MSWPATAQTDREDHGGSLPEGRVTIEEVHDPARLEEIEDLQIRVWGFEPRGVIPANALYIPTTHGGLVLGAYADGQLVGFVLGFLGQRAGRLYHVSHMLGVDPEHQGRGIGEALKRRQRELVLAQGLDRMVWTFDPLEARNAYFNLHKLRVFCRTYHENLYGELTSRLHRGLPTDRLLAEWMVHGDQTATLAPTDPTPILESVHDEPVLHLDHMPDGGPLTVSIPENIQLLKQEDPKRALAWRLAVREALRRAFAHGYVACDFVRGAYVLTVDGAASCEGADDVR